MNGGVGNRISKFLWRTLDVLDTALGRTGRLLFIFALGIHVERVAPAAIFPGQWLGGWILFAVLVILLRSWRIESEDWREAQRARQAERDRIAAELPEAFKP